MARDELRRASVVIGLDQYIDQYIGACWLRNAAARHVQRQRRTSSSEL